MKKEKYKCRNCGIEIKEMDNGLCEACWWRLYKPKKEEIDFEEVGK